MAPDSILCLSFDSTSLEQDLLQTKPEQGAREVYETVFEF